MPVLGQCAAAGLTPPSSGHAPASRGMSLMSNVRPLTAMSSACQPLLGNRAPSHRSGRGHASRSELARSLRGVAAGGSSAFTASFWQVQLTPVCAGTVPSVNNTCHGRVVRGISASRCAPTQAAVAHHARLFGHLPNPAVERTHNGGLGFSVLPSSAPPLCAAHGKR